MADDERPFPVAKRLAAKVLYQAEWPNGRPRPITVVDWQRMRRGVFARLLVAIETISLVIEAQLPTGGGELRLKVEMAAANPEVGSLLMLLRKLPDGVRPHPLDRWSSLMLALRLSRMLPRPTFVGR